MIDEMIATVRAALAPGADAATKQRAAAILRGVIGLLESGDPSSVGEVTAPAPTPSAPSSDLLTMIVEHLRPHLPPEALAEMPRFRVPIVDLLRRGT